MHMRNDCAEERGHGSPLRLAAAAGSASCARGAPPIAISNRSFEERAADLVSRMTLEEKIAQLRQRRAGDPAARACRRTNGGTRRCTAWPAPAPRLCFRRPSAWPRRSIAQLMHEVATAISDEARAKHHEFARRGQRGRYQGLTFWSPNINIFRDPRWGRGQETYGEDPWLTARMGVAFVKGLQGDDPKYRKVDATAKHFAVHSGPGSRSSSLRRASERARSVRDLPARVPGTGAGRAAWPSVMGAYNRVYGESASASPLPAAGDPARATGASRATWCRTAIRSKTSTSITRSSSTAAEAAALGVQERLRSRLRQDLRRAAAGGEAGTHQRSRDRRGRAPPDADAHAARHVRSAGARALGADSVLGQSVAGARCAWRGAPRSPPSCC